MSEIEQTLDAAKRQFLHGDFSSAEEAFRAALAKEPDSLEAHLGLAFALHAEQNYPAALRAFKNSLNRFPTNPELHFGYGLTLMESQDEYRAIRAFRRTLELQPDHPLCPQMLTKALKIHTEQLLEEKNYIWAEEMIESQLELDEHAPDALEQMVRLKNMMSEYDAAKRYFRILAETKPDHPAVFDLAKLLGIGRRPDRNWLY